MSKPWKWLESTKELQEQIYHYDYQILRDNPPALARYIDWNLTAAVQECAEVREEFSWKPWARDEYFVNRNRIRDEVIDVMHFLGNIMTAIGVTDGELEDAYQYKQDINRQRQASGTYSARKGGLSEGSDNAS